ncbi:MAG: hypothetical protein ACK5HP_05230 [Bacilli bacterium]
MKNWVKYYYNLIPNDIHQFDQKYKFNIGDDFYVIEKYDRDINEINEILKLIEYLNYNGIYCHRIVPNNNNEIITIMEGNKYILLKAHNKLEEKITLEYIEIFSNITYNIDNLNLKRNNWKELWSNKLDYFEYQLSQFGQNKPIIRESFHYFEGLAENAISLLNQATNSKITNVISHKRLKCNLTAFEFYNPLNFIIDFKVRDSCEYFKDLAVNKKDIYSIIEQYILESNFSYDEYLYFFIRLLYPTPYFDCFERIIENKSDEDNLKQIILSVNENELLLKKVYKLLSNYINMPDIEWLKK